MSDQNPNPPIATITPAQAEEGHAKPAPKEKSKVLAELIDEEAQAATARRAAELKDFQRVRIALICLIICIAICHLIPLALIIVGYYFIGDCPEQAKILMIIQTNPNKYHIPKP
ncbi:hypothetical protein WR25_13183 [Diploscapter pachys]|uniref:Uncharacterized protein n=1 Tax=Diploscapter pachys TaxID=2018661 RepID=A0A2A2L881_9BILA|nr:hypothetical protein WR25_13183 [Diploscapter pachys]